VITQAYRCSAACSLLGEDAELSWIFRGTRSLVYALAMIYRFESFELDTDKAELRANGAPVAIEPQVLALIALLAGNRERLVSRDEILEKIWEGRVVSDTAITSRIKSARKVLGDDGTRQRVIRTVNKLGLRFLPEVMLVHSAGTNEFVTVGARSQAAAAQPLAGSRPSIAVLPFRSLGDAAVSLTIAEALPHELIVELSRLRWLFVTARGSSFRLRGSETDMIDVGQLLGVRYCLSGTVELDAGTLGLNVQLADTRDGALVWADRFSGGTEDVHRIRADIRARVLGALEIQIPMHEAALARLRVSENLDAWSAYHLGLQHMYRFNRQDNAAASVLFKQATRLDPGFARAHAGLSFVHFQSGFLRYDNDLRGQIEATRLHASRAVELDPIDPFVNYTMGRSFWLRGELEESLGWLERATAFSPSYAQGHYAAGWAESLAGRGLQGREKVDLAMRLSPLDPLFYAMLATRALSHIAVAEYMEAVLWAERAARAPGAHVLIVMIAGAANALVGKLTAAQAWADIARGRNSNLGRADFFKSFPMKSEEMRTRVNSALELCGFT